MNAGGIVRVLQILFIVGGLVLVVPAVVYISDSKSVNGGTLQNECITEATSDDRARETCSERYPPNLAVVGLTYAVFSLACMTAAVALRPSRSVGRSAGAPLAAPAGPAPLPGGHSPQGWQQGPPTGAQPLHGQPGGPPHPHAGPLG